MRKNAKDRSRAVELRRYLIDAEIDYTMLQNAYDEKSGAKDAISIMISKTLAGKKEKVRTVSITSCGPLELFVFSGIFTLFCVQDMNDLIDLIMSHFNKCEEIKHGKGKEVGQGEPTITITTHPNESGTSASSAESDEEEFEKVHEEIAEK